MLGNTPMFLQYNEIKKDLPDTILFYRLGDFYEMFGNDAIEASKLLGLALTARDGGNVKVPMCGVPFHAAEMYIKKLVNAGKKVAICEQVEDPKTTKGIVKREVIRIITPGMLLDENLLEVQSNFIACIEGKSPFGLAVADISTGEFFATLAMNETDLLQELLKYNPSELVFSDENGVIQNLLLNYKELLHKVNPSPYTSYLFKEKNAFEKLKKHFSINDLSVLNFNNLSEDLPVIVSSAVLLGYIEEMIRIPPKQLIWLNYYKVSSAMQLDLFTKRNLELIQSNNYQQGTSLFEILNHTSTSGGSRLLKRWIEEPLIDKDSINMRLSTTEELFNNFNIRSDFIDHLKAIQDIDRIASRISCLNATPRDLIALKKTLLELPQILNTLNKCHTPLFKKFEKQFDTLEDIYQLIESSILDEPSNLPRDGHVIRPSYNETLSHFTELINHGENWLEDYLRNEKEATGIKNLKIGYNKVFGYYLDVTKSYQHLVPDTYVRKQTLANSERYITDKLKNMENELLSASEKAKNLEVELFKEILQTLQKSVERILNTSRILSQIDVFVTFASLAIKYNYCKPEIVENNVEISSLRHAVIERKITEIDFTPNDVKFDKDNQRFIIITGPNMSGKSTYCRSIALAIILAQIGCFIPATAAKIKIFDRVFARIGANDYLSNGQSTFMVEMNEVATIVNNATQDSLIILDEVGRGTSTYDGLALATAITKYINENIKAFTLFATHYHELVDLEKYSGIKNYTVTVQETSSTIHFLHKIIEGSTNKSYGIHVAKKAGIPIQITNLANKILGDLEKNKTSDGIDTLYEFDEKECYVEELPSWINELKALNIENMTIREMANTLMDFVEKANS